MRNPRPGHLRYAPVAGPRVPHRSVRVCAQALSGFARKVSGFARNPTPLLNKPG
jgi:hypothetical protein